MLAFKSINSINISNSFNLGIGISISQNFDIIPSLVYIIYG